MTGGADTGRLTIGILAHVDAGKTTLSESILYNTGVIRSMGRVDRGDSFFDTDSMERERGITIFSKQAVFPLPDGRRVTLMDTPGHADFSPEAERVLWVLDYAILVISAPDGAGGRSRQLFRLLERYSVPVFIFVNKMDMPGCEKDQVMSGIRSCLSGSCVDFSPEAGDAFYEDLALADGDEEVMDAFLSTGMLEDDYIRELILTRKVFPVLFGSALKDQGVDELLSVIGRYVLSQSASADDAFGARVIKISADPDGNRLTHLKVTGGSFKVREAPLGDEKITGIRIYSGDRYESVPEAKAGGVYAVTGLTGTYGGQGMGSEPDAPSGIMTAVMTYALYPPEGVDPSEMMKKLSELCEYMPELKAEWDEELREIHVSIMGSVQTEILTRMIKDRYGLSVTFGAGRIIYRETIADTVEGVGHFEPLRHYAEVHLGLEGAPRGSGISVSSVSSVDELSLNWQRLIETHILERTHRGVLTGSAITDMKITILGGRAHIKHTMGGDFRQATYRAIRQGLMQARSVLLEPYYDFEVNVPRGFVGRVMTELGNRFAKLSSPEETEGGETLIRGRAPAATMQDYPEALAAGSSGQGSITFCFSGYDICHNSEEVMEDFAYDPEADLRNTPDSVFCSHGAGTVVPWDQVFSHMHVPLKLEFDENGEYIGHKTPLDEAKRLEEAGARARSRYVSSKMDDSRRFIGYEEVDAIISRASSSNIKNSKREGEAGWKKIRRSSVSDDTKKVKSYGVVKKEGYMLIDGYNVIYSIRELKELVLDNPDSARDRLLDMVSNYRGMKDHDIIVVFDAYRVPGSKDRPERYNNIFVVYTPMAMTADAYIEKYAHENASKYDITVVTSDALEQVIIRGAGCRLMSAGDFKEELDGCSRAIRQSHTDTAFRSGNSLYDNLSLRGRQEIDNLGKPEERTDI